MPVRKSPCLFRRLLRRRVHRQRLVWLASLSCIASVVSHAPAVTADVPAETDFGQVAAERVWDSSDTDSAGYAPAVFITLYPDGTGACEVRSVTDDSVAGFAGEHPAWKLDEGFMWFVQMPVYVRVLGDNHAPDAIDEV